jgi:hypothetical protein
MNGLVRGIQPLAASAGGLDDLAGQQVPGYALPPGRGPQGGGHFPDPRSTSLWSSRIRIVRTSPANLLNAGIFWCHQGLGLLLKSIESEIWRCAPFAIPLIWFGAGRIQAGDPAGANNIPRGAECVLEQPLVPADSCVLKFRVNHSESAFATASPVSVGRAASLQRWPASPHPIRSSAPQPSTFASVTKEPSSSSGSALSAGQPCSTRKKVTNNRPWGSPWAPSPTQAFLHLKIRSMTVAGIPGFNYRQGQPRTTRTPPSEVTRPKKA